MSLGRKRSTRLQSRIAILAMFFINGALLANWVARIPAIQENLSLSESALGLSLIGVSAGVLFALSLAGGLIARYSSRRVTFWAAGMFCLLLPLPALATNVLTLFAALFFVGGAISMQDMAMNAQAVELERRYARPMINSFHAGFSIGGFVGALMGAALVRIGFAPLPHFALVGGLFLIVAFIAKKHLIEIDGETANSESQAVFSLPHRAVWPIGAVGFVAAIGEGSMADWTAVYLRSSIGTSAAVAALGFAAFSLLMTTGRLLGDWITTKIKIVPLVRVGGAVAALGLFLAMSVPSVPLILLGFGAVGLGISIIFPLVFRAVGNLPDVPAGVGLAGVATLGYTGFLAGPPLIGLVADALSLRIALLGVALLLGTLIFSAGALGRTQPVDAAS